MAEGAPVAEGVLMPVRIQRRRAPGWRMPEGAIYVGRPSRWGNPFWVGKGMRDAQGRATEALEAWDATDGPESFKRFADAKAAAVRLGIEYDRTRGP